MMRRKFSGLLKLVSACACLVTASGQAADNIDQCKVKDTVSETIEPLMKKHTLPGVAVAVTVNGQQCFYNFGVMSRDAKQGVTNDTIFEIGSISKTFTATLATYAQATGKLSLADKVSQYLPSLKGSSFDTISLLNLGTHTAGGLPLQVPDDLQNMDQLMGYFKNWKPKHAAGTSRTYSNLSVGLLGMAVAKGMQVPFDDAMEKQLFPALGLTHTYLTVPPDQMRHYAQGYNAKDAPVRMKPDLLAAESYGVRTTTADLIRYVGINMQQWPVEAKWARAISDAQIAYFKSGQMTQSLMWEQYPYPVKLEQLVAGNSVTMVFDDHPASRANASPQAQVLINKTGSTSGFGAYVAFIPARKIGIVILANKSYPSSDRVTAAYRILTQLDGQMTPKN